MAGESASAPRDITVPTPLGTFSATTKPTQIADTLAISAVPLAASGVHGQANDGIIHLLVNRVPRLCELLLLAQLDPGTPTAAILFNTLLRCFQNMSTALNSLRQSFQVRAGGAAPTPASDPISEGSLMAYLQYLDLRFEDISLLTPRITHLYTQQSAGHAAATAALLDQVWKSMDVLDGILSAVAGAQVPETVWAEIVSERVSGDGQEIQKIPGLSQLPRNPNDQTRLLTRLSPTGDLILLMTRTTHMVHDMRTGHQIVTIPYSPATGVDAWVFKPSSIAWSPDGLMFAAASGRVPNLMFICNALTGERTFFPVAEKGVSVTSVAWGPGPDLVTGTSAGTVSVWDTSSVVDTKKGILMHEFTKPGAGVEEVAWSPDGSKVSVTDLGPEILVWDAATQAETTFTLNEMGPVSHALWSPDSSKLATIVQVAQDPELVMFDVSEGKVFNRYVDQDFDRGPYEITAASFSPDSKRIAIATRNFVVGVWDVNTGTPGRQVPMRLGRDTRNIVDLVWRPDGSQIVTAAEGGRVDIFDVRVGFNPDLPHRPGVEVYNYQTGINPFSTVWGLAGHELISSSEFGSVRVHAVPPVGEA